MIYENIAITLFCIFVCVTALPKYDLATESLKLSDVKLGYKVSAFANIVKSKRHVDLVFVKDEDHKTVTVRTYNDRNISYEDATGYTYTFGDDALTDYKIIGLLPGDFDSDKITDVMVVFEDSKNLGNFKTSIIRNKNGKFNSSTIDPNLYSSIPHLLDYNGDNLIDYVAEMKGKRYIFLNSQEEPGNFMKTVNIIDSEEYAIDYAKRENKYVFADFNGDFKTDLVSILPLKDKNSHIVEFYEAKEDKLHRIWTTKVPDIATATQFGAPIAVDMDGNGKLDIVVPACNGSFVNGKCSGSKIITFYNDPCLPTEAKKCRKFHPGEKYEFILKSENIGIFDKFQNDKDLYSFMAFEEDKMFSSMFMLRAVDFDSDSNMDLVAILQFDDRREVVFFTNIEDDTQVGLRYLRPVWIKDIVCIENGYEPYAIAPIDAMSNGNPQFFLLGQDRTKRNKFSLDIYISDSPVFDTFWFKITVLCIDCDDSSTTMIGSNAYYYTTGVKGEGQVGYGTQNSLVTASSLQPPYVLFGLGQQANYIEKLEVKYRVTKKGRYEVDGAQFDNLIPNAQVFAIPRSSGDWKLVMLVIPGKLLWETLAVLGVCCLVCAIIILALHIKEKKEDDREKRRFNAKFNFSAM